MPELIDKEVYFGQYCSSCVHKDLKEEEDPCADCLDYPVNANSHKPIHYEKRKEK